MSESKAEKKGLEPLLGKERAQILLHEYNGLRNEIIHRTNNLYQVITIGALVLGWIVSSHEFDAKLVIVLLVVSVILGCLLWFISRDIGKAADRLARSRIMWIRKPVSGICYGGRGCGAEERLDTGYERVLCLFLPDPNRQTVRNLGKAARLCVHKAYKGRLGRRSRHQSRP